MKRDKKAENKKLVRFLSRAEAEKKRMAVLATELGFAAVQVLREEFGFDEAQGNKFLELWIARAHKNRDEFTKKQVS